MIGKNHKHYLFFILECLIGTVTGFVIYRLYPVIGSWCLFSIILVLAPDRKDAIALATNRIKANLIGAIIGLSLCYFHPVGVPMICLGVATAMLVCEWLKLSAATKSAIVAMFIISMHEPGPFFWDIALERAWGVILGCLIGVVITLIFHAAGSRFSDTAGRTKPGFGKKPDLNDDHGTGPSR